MPERQSVDDHLVSSRLGKTIVGTEPVRKASLDSMPELGDGHKKTQPKLGGEFARAKEYILKRYLGGGDKFFAKLGQKASFFETNIRIVGGLLSAYEFDGDRRLVDAACVVADRLVSAFYWDRGRFNIPLNEVNMTRYNVSNAASPLT
ncbi:hypothetical protein HK405_004595 [Cladochytrium tenue]|nr:hypothetical protein HK405_004595 [Cladochytrium tenue]